VNAVPTVRVERIAGAAIIALVGEHDLGTRDHVRDAVSGALAEGFPVVIDLAAADFVDSVVAAVLLEARREAKAQDLGLGIVLSDSAANQVRRMFELSELTTVFTVYPSREAALDGIREGFGEPGRTREARSRGPLGYP
jgi:anti-anti-sigma factor